MTIFTLDHSILDLLISFMIYVFFFFRLFDILEPGMCHFIDREADLSRSLPPTDAHHPGYETIRGDRQRLKSNFL